MTKISIITICYNSEKTIEDTIKSVIKQNYDNLEYIIIDGASTDNTLNIINKYKKHISKIVSEPDNGISDAFNKGIKLATGDIIGLINSDDLLNKDALINLDKFVRKNLGYDVYYGDVIIFNSKFNYLRKINSSLSRLKLQFILNHPSTFITKKAYEEYGLYDNEYKICMDFELLSKFYLNGAKFIHIDYIMTLFRLGGISNQNIIERFKEDKKVAIRNGCNKIFVNIWYTMNVIKRLIIKLIFLLHMESFTIKVLRKKIIPNELIKWYL